VRILIVGAGSVGGYFGGRLLQANRDVTFLVRARRAAELAKKGLCIKSPAGDAMLPPPPCVLSEQIASPFDVVIVASKAYDLPEAIESFAAAVGPQTTILPLLNGLRHLDLLSERFGPANVLGGQCMISAVLDPDGTIVHLNDIHLIAFGERDGSMSPVVLNIAAEFAGANFKSRASGNILQEMWEKWVFIATGAGITCLMRAPIGDIVAAGAGPFAIQLFEECAAIAAEAGYPPSTAAAERTRATFTMPGSLLTASMFRDIERGAATEGDHILGDLLRRGTDQADAYPVLNAATAHLRTYEVRRGREAK
jgi:2-dehydropantoate 2-reductase